MSHSMEKVYTFRGATPAQVDDLCDLWRESVVEFSRQRGFVKVKTDALAIDQFCLCYGLLDYLECDNSNSAAVASN